MGAYGCNGAVWATRTMDVPLLASLSLSLTLAVSRCSEVLLLVLLLPKHVCLEDHPEAGVQAVDDPVVEQLAVVAVHHGGHFALWNAPGKAMHDLRLHPLGGACGSHA